MNINAIFKNPERKLLRLVYKFSKIIPSKTYLRWVYYLKNKEWLDLNNPKTYNEKINWLKLYDRNPLYTKLVDKFSVKQYVADIIGEDYIIPTLGLWDKPEDIEWDKLPNQFVLKTTHGGGNNGVVICKDKTKLDRSLAVQLLKKAMKQNIYKRLREWPYKNVPRKIIAEKYMEDLSTGELRDYKFFAFDGVVKALFIATERSSGNVKFDFFDSDFNHLDLVQSHPMSGKTYQRPVCFEEMKKVAETLSKGLLQVRIDLYEINGRVYFGEYTFYHHGGVVPFHPYCWDQMFGSWIDINRIQRNKD